MDNERKVATKEIVERQMRFLALWHACETRDIAAGKTATPQNCETHIGLTEEEAETYLTLTDKMITKLEADMDTPAIQSAIQVWEDMCRLYMDWMKAARGCSPFTMLNQFPPPFVRG